jgi:hypothetical protein
MVGVPRPYTGATNAIRAVPGWRIALPPDGNIYGVIEGRNLQALASFDA